MLREAIHVNQFLVGFGQRLLSEIPDERMTEQPLPGVNHPAWILGHLALTADGVGEILGGKRTLPAEWSTLFGQGSQPSSVRSGYPSKSELLRAFEECHHRLREQAAAAGPEVLAQPPTNPRAREVFPTLKELATFILTGHVGVHLGQLSAWRRMIGLPPTF
jgi:hypothetical protein